MNLIDIEDRLKDLSDQQLMQQMQRPDGTAPQFLVMSELKRRKEMRDRAPAPETTTVKDDLVQQGIASVANQMAPQDGIPRFNNGMFPGTNIAVRPTVQDYARYYTGARDRVSGAISGNQPVFDLSPRGPSVRDMSLGIIPEETGQGRQRVADLFSTVRSYLPTFKNEPPRPRSARLALEQGADVSAGSTSANELGPENEVSRETEAERLARMRAAAGDVYPFSGNYNQTDAEMYTGREGPVFSEQPITAANREAARFMPFDGAASPEVTNPQNQPPARSNQFAGTSGRPNLLGGLNVVPRGTAMPGGVSGDYGEVNAATDYDRAYNQIMSAPPSAAPAAPPTNYYEGIEKKLAALQEAETGPDVGMALLRAGLGIAQAGGEGKSTAAAIGAGGIAGLDAYEADKKAKQARQMQLMGVESQLAGAKTQQAYNQQKLALDARMRDNQDKMLQLKGLGMSMDDDRKRALAANQNQLKLMGLQLQEQKINFDADLADRKLKQMVDEGKIKGDYYEALTDKANRGDSIDRYLNATPEVRALLLPLLRKNNASLQGDIGESAMKLMDDPLWVEQTRERLKKEAGGREIGINAVVMEARRLSELGYGQGGGAPQGPRDDARIRR